MVSMDVNLPRHWRVKQHPLLHDLFVHVELSVQTPVTRETI